MRKQTKPLKYFDSFTEIGGLTGIDEFANIKYGK